MTSDNGEDLSSTDFVIRLLKRLYKQVLNDNKHI